MKKPSHGKSEPESGANGLISVQWKDDPGRGAAGPPHSGQISGICYLRKNHMLNFQATWNALEEAKC